MKSLLLILALVLLSLNLFSQDVKYEDVVYLKNGSIIYGQILEQVPGEYIKIKSGEKNLLVFRMNEIERIVKNEIKPPPNPATEKLKKIEIKQKGYELSIGMSGFATPPSSYFFNTTYSSNGFGFSLTNSYRFSPRLVAGVGIAYEYFHLNESVITQVKSMPVFIDVQFSFFNYPISPLLSFSGGYTFGWVQEDDRYDNYDFVKKDDVAGLLLNPMIGVKFVFVKHASLLVRLGYKMQQFTVWDYHYGYYDYQTHTNVGTYSSKKRNFSMMVIKVEYVF